MQILVDSNHQELAMKQKPQKDVIDIVSFDLIGLLPTNHIIYIIYKLWHIRVKMDVLQYYFIRWCLFFVSSYGSRTGFELGFDHRGTICPLR